KTMTLTVSCFPWVACEKNWRALVLMFWMSTVRSTSRFTMRWSTSNIGSTAAPWPSSLNAARVKVVSPKPPRATRPPWG
ncbi:Cytochrome D ubiquinol oxidase subunit II, partial [Dysosmobacter welbionis]